MATVYLAHDLRNNRKVALKVLRPELAAILGGERFLKEIETTANLQHPHILPLFDSGEAGTFLFYVMPYIEGESLRGRLSREKQLPIADGVRIATEVASALDYAHRHGVLHRDIKPENILLHDGQALVADFGIALAMRAAGGARLTETGLSLGTPQYMSPEQATAERELDARTDVYALGAVTYEMLTGEPPFMGNTTQAIIAKLMTEAPRPPSVLRRAVPEAVERAVLTALEKLPADRFGSAAEFAQAIKGEMPAGSATGRTPVRIAPPIYRRPGILAAMWLVTAAIGAWGWGQGRATAPPLVFGHAVKVTYDPGLEVQPAISPDGKSVAYSVGTSANLRVFVRPVSGGHENAVTDDTTDAQSLPRWSPDGSRILFLSHGGVFSAPAAGGPARQEVPAGNGSPVRSADWAPDGARIAYVVGDTLFIRNADGSSRTLARMPEPNLCTWSPDGTAIACSRDNALFLSIGPHFGNLSPSRIVICRVADGTLLTVSDSTSLNQSPIWSPDGRWLYFISDRQGPRDIYALRIGGDGRPTGAQIRLTVGLGAQSISLSHDGQRLAYAVYTATSNVWSVPMPAGAPISVREAVPITRGNQNVEQVRLSRDEQWLLYDSDLSGSVDVYRLRLTGGEPERLTTDPGDEFFPDLSPDGKEIAFHSWLSGSRDIYVMPLDGRPRQQVTRSPRQEAAAVWSPDGTSLAYCDLTTGGLWISRRNPDGSWQEPVQRLQTGFEPAWSPDGRTLSFSTLLTGGGLGIVPVDSGPVRILLDPARPGQPAAELSYWSRDGKTIYFKSHDTRGVASILSVPAAGGKPRLLVKFDDPLRPSYRINLAIGNRRTYFTIDDRQSDVWVMDVAP